jgi:acetyl-CoA carboxylase biotin carboxyl carrier protein|tara:strand:- start:46899 stop:47369 length:471 start_codon:yes stop_codon:yes gene_type:complete
MNVDTKLVKELAKLLADTGLSEIEVEDGDRKIRVARQMMAAQQSFAAAPMPAPAAASAPASASTGTAAADDAAADLKSHAGAVKSPMVGTAYLSPEPGAANFVKEGDRVEAGDTLLIVEAMKVMNPIVAPRAGTVTKLCATNEAPVEFDEVLAIVE